MKIYDISQEVFDCEVYPGDQKPKKSVLAAIGENCIYNLTAFSMCAHNGTHVDAPLHFYKDGMSIDKIQLEHFIGKCYVTYANGLLSAEDAEKILKKAKNADVEAAKRIIIGGKVTVTIEAAKVFAREKILLIGNESQSVGPVNSPAQVHYELLGAEVVLLEGIRLDKEEIKEGVYILNAAPINLGGVEGAPCRAILM